jgi:hypothetical protein
MDDPLTLEAGGDRPIVTMVAYRPGGLPSCLAMLCRSPFAPLKADWVARCSALVGTS